MKNEIVTIDGPSGVGKSTVSRIVASELGYTYLDTGAMYRAVGYYFFKNNIDPEDVDRINPMLAQIHLTLKPADSVDEDVGVIINGDDISSKIRTPEMSMIASTISALPCVRGFLTEQQRAIGKPGGVVAEGRDMGTVVFPGAKFKFYLDADPEERCRRRVNQLREKGQQADEEHILKMILLRDKNDSERAVAPLKRASDARLINTTSLSIEKVGARILHTIRQADS